MHVNNRGLRCIHGSGWIVQARPPHNGGVIPFPESHRQLGNRSYPTYTRGGGVLFPNTPNEVGGSFNSYLAPFVERPNPGGR